MEKIELVNELNYIEQVFTHNMGVDLPKGILQFGELKGRKDNFYFDFTISEIDFKNQRRGLGRFIKRDKKLIVTILESAYQYESKVETLLGLWRHQITEKNGELILENTEGVFTNRYYTSSRLLEKMTMISEYTIDELISLPNIYELFEKNRGSKTKIFK